MKKIVMTGGGYRRTCNAQYCSVCSLQKDGYEIHYIVPTKVLKKD